MRSRFLCGVSHPVLLLSRPASSLLLLAAVGFAFSTSAEAASPAGYAMEKSVIAGGGALNSSGGGWSVSGTVGQSAVGMSEAPGAYLLSAGFWAVPVGAPSGDPPRLYLETLGDGHVRIFWPLPAQGWVLDQAPALGMLPLATVWTQVSFPYATNATEVFLEVAPQGSRYYRLRKQ